MINAYKKKPLSISNPSLWIKKRIDLKPPHNDCNKKHSTNYIVLSLDDGFDWPGNWKDSNRLFLPENIWNICGTRKKCEREKGGKRDKEKDRKNGKRMHSVIL